MLKPSERPRTKGLREAPMTTQAPSAPGRADGPLWTIQALLAWTTKFFTEKGMDSARLDAEVLLAHALGESRIDLYLRYERPVPPEALARFRGFVQRRARREPVAYITGLREFYSIPLSVGPEVLIPRPETEHVVERALAEANRLDRLDPFRVLQILDVGTGSGNIAVALARHLPRARIMASDRSWEALLVARKNAWSSLGPSAGAIRFLQADLLSAFHPNKARFDLIVSNPPYVPSKERQRLPEEVRSYEPWCALDGGPDGMQVLRNLIATAPSCLAKGGALVCEVGEEQKESLLAFATQTGNFASVQFADDYAGKPRVLVAHVA